MTQLAPVQRIPGDSVEDKAYWLEERIKDGCAHVRKASLFLGWAFHQVVADGLFEKLGYSSFTQFLDQQGIDMKKDSALRLMRVYNQLCMVAGFKPEELADIGISKLDVIQRYIGKDKPKTLVHLARENTRSQLIDLLKETYDDGLPTPDKDLSVKVVTVTCPACNKTWKQAVTI